MRYIRFSIIALGCAFALSATAQDLNQKVTYKTVAVSVKKVVDDLAQMTRANIDTSPAVSKEIVVINVSDVSLQVLMNRIASVTSCEWQKTSEGLLLVRSSDKIREEVNEEITARTAAVKKAIEKLMEPYSKVPVFDDKTAQDIVANRKPSGLGGILQANGAAGAAQGARAMFTQGADQPAGRATARLLSMLDPTVLAKMGDDDRLVFSSRPNRMQAALPVNALQVINQFIQEQNIWADAVARQTNGQKNIIDQAIGMAMGASDAPVKGVPDKALLCIERSAMLDNFDVRLKIFDQGGNILFQGGQSILLDTSILNVVESLLKTEPTKDAEIELTPDSKELLDFYRSMSNVMFGTMKASKFSPGLMAKLTRPNKYDPLSFIQSEAILAIAKSHKEQLVANVPDTILRASSYAMPGQKLTANGFLKQITSLALVEIEEKDGWLTMKPARPYYNRLRRVDRVALAKLIGQGISKGYVSLDDLANYALYNRPLMDSEIAQSYALILVPGAATMMSGQMNWDMLRLYAMLSLPQRQALSRGESISFRNLFPTEQDCLKRLIFLPKTLMGGTSVTIKRNGGQPGQAMPNFMGTDFRSEPTELLPGGLPMDGSLTLSLTSDTVVKDAGENQPRIQLFSAFNAEELAAFSMLKEDATLGNVIGGMVPDLKKFRMAERKTYRFTFDLTPEASILQTLTDLKYDPNGSVVDINGMPDTFRKKFQDTQEQLKKVGGIGAILGGGGGGPKATP